MSPGLIVICGPTATGKSSLAMAIAQKFSLPILSADSRQVYQEFNIGTAKPTLREQQQVPHFLIDLVAPTATLSVAQYQRQAQSLIQQFQDQGIVPLLTGGTGLYIKSITHNLKIPRVAPHPQLRSQLGQWDQAILHHWLQQVDSPSAQRIHPRDRLRTLRALEVFYVTGKPLSQQQGESPVSYPILFLGLDLLDRTQQTQRICDRTHQMFALGWIEEVKGIVERYGPALPLLKTLGYAEILDYLQGRANLPTTQQAIVRHTRQFAKRQRTWFRANPDIHWFDPSAPGAFEKMMESAALFLESTAA
ncbi:tRNA (adenosine(37)-N6)-dimethylallyltransferase MiaA [Lyngbya confervoides]|uniref:tRNA dimethylallyltransferase n=1 Tax=Lyngbya confervoides BDU141951 TaxID=1574623 RepID=A0ABD4T8B8_9CYAN|nr:tRNA (adenosine(37)-N6)-dimethylallyltransferase MiaA [Lyngbya confervoides]MCM1984733.1 tRNA (adenosine(37)-N6)-dimethylallyltransferase MiaA [Lyngbya confervoides BDU141951]